MKPDNDQIEINELSELELAIQNRERKTFECEIQDVLGNSGKPLGKVFVRIATISEQEKAILESNKYIEEKSKEAPTVVSDLDFTQNVKTTHILHKVCLKKRGNIFMPAFSTPKWMLENLGALELGSLLDYYNEVVRVASNVKSKFSPDTLKAFAKFCSENTSSREPNEYLSKMSYDETAEALVLMSIMYHEANIGQNMLADQAAKYSVLDNFKEIKELK